MLLFSAIILGPQKLLKWGRSCIVCCWLHRGWRARPGNIWKFPPLIFPLDLDTLPEAASLNIVCLCLLVCLSPTQLYFLLRKNARERCFSCAPSQGLQPRLSILYGSSTAPGVTSNCAVRLPEQEVPLQLSSQSLLSSKITAIALAPKRAGL